MKSKRRLQMLKIKKMRQFGLVMAVLLITAILTLGLSACQSPGGRTTGEYVDDTTLGTRVKTELFKDPTLSGFAISVDVFNGEVTLTGGVDRQETKNHAGEVTRSVRGVKAVNNLLTVQSQ
jgi:hyperosmotically inducible periplasmic protein